MLTPLLALIAWPEEWRHSLGFLFPAIILAGSGLGIWRFFKPGKSVALTVQEAGVIVLLSWVLISFFSACPFVIIQHLTITQAIFEAVSGWTTTGLSVINVEQASHIILLWRSIMQLAGGAGLAIIMLASLVGPSGSGLSEAEGRSDQLAPHVQRSARLVLTIYGTYGIVGILAYWLAGMTWFDAINHAFAAISTGGFSTRSQSIGYWDSAIIEAVTLPLMVLGNLNFLTAYMLFHRRFGPVSQNGEVRVMALLIPTSTAILFLMVCNTLYPSLDKAFRVALFETISALTTTGSSTVGYSDWNALGYVVMVVLMLIGGGTGSTAGGIKQYRIYLMYKSIMWEIQQAFQPKTAVVENYIWQGGQKDFVTDRRLRQIGMYIALYMFVYFIGVGILAAHGYGFKESLFEFASALGTVGLSVGLTSVQTPPFVLWTETLGMLLGRLEFFVIFIAFAKILRDLSAAVRSET
jgi:trk system potassium uptake protein TrkH